jgi:hypothetical protein
MRKMVAFTAVAGSSAFLVAVALVAIVELVATAA